MQRLYGVRGAVCTENNADSIVKNTVEMFKTAINENDIQIKDMVSIQFSITNDIDELNPCTAVRKFSGLDISEIPLFCTQEAYIKGGLAKVIRMLIYFYAETDECNNNLKKINNVYLNGAEVLRPDRARV